MIILDTNVVSELIKDAPDPPVRAWANAQPRRALLTTSITVMELRAGVEKLLQSRRRQELEAGIEWALDELLGGRVLDFDRRAALAAAGWYGHCRRAGRPLQATDMQIAGIAICRDFPVATRDVDDFAGIGVKVINPWTTAI
ncbi:MAG TPA: type II toxin-antitoxin system VapC family toxin [Hyphomicrobiaceae bacterium]|jgi:predicted nucleic acid-binding protein|nr:type II toxin-antitoxin system VapC family toxin [Hyphomicrobiaceae bacterium]